MAAAVLRSATMTLCVESLKSHRKALEQDSRFARVLCNGDDGSASLFCQLHGLGIVIVIVNCHYQFVTESVV